MLHNLVPTLNPSNPKVPSAAKSSTETLSRALPVQTSPDDLGKGIAGGNDVDMTADPGKARPGDAKKKKALLSKLNAKVKLLDDKLEELGVLVDDVQGSSILWLVSCY